MIKEDDILICTEPFGTYKVWCEYKVYNYNGRFAIFYDIKNYRGHYIGSPGFMKYFKLKYKVKRNLPSWF